MHQPKQTLYLETSVVAAYYEIKPRFMRDHTRTFWKKYLKNYQVFISKITQKEIKQYAGDNKSKLLKLIDNFQILKINNDVQKITKGYVDHKIIHQHYLDDALHLALAVNYKIDYLISWNLKHLVKPQQQLKIKNFNIQQKLHIPIICTPSYFLTIRDL